jgi:two-component sensor histidine kinase
MMVRYDKLYHSESHHEMNAGNYILSHVEEIVRIFNSPVPVKTDIHVDNIVLSAKNLSTPGIIINELITNSMKYVFDNLDEGLISLSLKAKDNRVTVVYSDNGPGIPESVDFGTSTGFGLDLVKMLAEQLNGTPVIVDKEMRSFMKRYLCLAGILLFSTGLYPEQNPKTKK